MANDMTRLLATVSALGLSLGVTFDAAAAAPATSDAAAPADAAATPAAKKLVAVKTTSWSHDKAVAAEPPAAPTAKSSAHIKMHATADKTAPQ